MHNKKMKVAAVQVSPILPMNKQKTLSLVCDIICEAAAHGAKLIVFPECYFPMYPNWSIDLQNPNEWALNLRELTYNSIQIPGPETDQICKVAKEKEIFVILGANEVVESSDGTLYNSLVFIGPSGKIEGRHRKLFPSNREKVFHARGDASGLMVHHTSMGRIGGLICYEHLQPLLKYALIAQGEQIHCASWPGWPNFPNGRSNIHVIDTISRAYALEGQCFVIVSSLYVPETMSEKAGFGNASWSFFGGSGIINPSGEYIAGPLYDQEGIVYGDIDLSHIPLRKAAIDTTGRDSAWETINMNIDPSPRYPIHWKNNKSKISNRDTEEEISEMLKNMEERLQSLEKSSNKA